MNEKSNRRRSSDARKPLSVLAPLRQIMRQVEKRQKTRAQLQAFADGVNPFAQSPASISDAITILGADKVVLFNQALEVFPRISLVGTSELPQRVCYTRETLHECAILNRLGNSRWRMFYALPLSFSSQSQFVSDPWNFSGTFSGSESWLTYQPAPGYYLIDFQGHFRDNPWNEQYEQIAKFAAGAYARADERIVSQGLLSFQNTHNEHLDPERCHWGRLETSDGCRVTVSSRNDRSVSIGKKDPSKRFADLAVYLFKNFDF